MTMRELASDNGEFISVIVNLDIDEVLPWRPGGPTAATECQIASNHDPSEVKGFRLAMEWI